MLKRCIHISLLLVFALLAVGPLTAAAADGIEWRGLIDSRPAGNIGTWVVGGVSFEANQSTQFDEAEGPLNVGACAKVRYFVSGSDNIALEIDSEPANDCEGGEENEQKIYALIEVIPANLNDGVWTIGGIDFISNANTDLLQEHGPFAVGVCAEVEYIQSSGDNIAKKIATEDAFRCNGGVTTNEAYGLLDSFPAGFVGDWVIADITYQATAATEFNQEDGAFVVGGCVKVRYSVQGGVNQAVEIETQNGDDCTPTNRATEAKLYATIDSFPTSPFTGTWTIGGLTFEATAATEFDQAEGPFGLGVCVQAHYRLENNVRLLREVDTEAAYKCQDGGGQPLFRAYGRIESFPDNLIGSWQVSGVTYQTDGTTRFEQPHGFFAVGAFVEVKFIDLNTVVSIETHAAPRSGFLTVLGELETHDLNDDWSDWVINGQTYKADPAIEAGTNGLPLSLGRPVLVNVYRGFDGLNYITSAEQPYQRFLPAVER